MIHETILVDVADGIALLTLNRPDVRNAINLDMVREIHAALDDLAVREDVRALVVAGAGKAFAGGADIGELRERRRDDALRSINQGLFRHVEEFPQPTIAALHGWVLGAGCELAMACDLRVAEESARLGQPEVGLGIVPAAGGTQRLARLVGLGRAREMIFTGQILTADEAREAGLVNRVVPDGGALAGARALAAEIAKHDALALRLSKLAINAGAGAIAAGPALESVGQAVCFESDEKMRRMSEFLEERERRRREREKREETR